MTTYYKAVRPDGADFHSGTVQWATPGRNRTRPRTVKHPTAKQVGGDASEYLSVSTVPTDCTGMQWPCRLLTVEPVEGYPVTTPDPDTLPHKRASVAWRVTNEVDAHAALGPQSAQIATLIARAATLTPDEARRLRAAWADGGGAAWGAAWDAARDAAWGAAWDAARDAAWDAARGAARGAARDAVWDAARDAVWDAARALIVRDLISTEHYDTLTTPWRTVIGPIHPDDPTPTDQERQP